MNNPIEPESLTIPQACARFNWGSEQKVRGWIKAGLLKAYRPPKTRLFKLKLADCRAFEFGTPVKIIKASLTGRLD